MKEQEKNLRRKLDLSNEDFIQLKPFERDTRNKNYVLEVNGVPSYFAKVNAEGKEREKVMYDFLEKFPIFNTIHPTYNDGKLMLLPFKKDLKDADVRDNLDFIVNYHNAALCLEGSDVYKKFETDENFQNYNISRFLIRLDKHPQMVQNLWKDINSLKSYFNSFNDNGINKLPKILVHGDIQHKNLQEDSDKNLYLLDFEDTCYTNPAWDLSRPLMDLEKDEVNDYRDEYVKKVNVKDKKAMIKSINRDFVVRVITNCIGMQQRYGEGRVKELLDMYRGKYVNKLEQMIYGKS